MAQPTYLSAAEAAEALGVSLPTLYAYVSRGLIRSEAEGAARSRRYRREDVEALVRRKRQRQDPEKAVEAALHLGAPVLESALTLIDGGRCYYRGRDAVALAEAWSPEQVAVWLWSGEETAPFPELTPARLAPGLAAVFCGMRPIDAFSIAVPAAGAADPGGFDRRPAAVMARGAAMVRLLVSVAGLCEGRSAPSGPLAEGLAAGWAAAHPEAVRLLGLALSLCADHELNVSAFTARCAASAGASPYGVVSAGLAALSGPKHGGHCERVEALFREAGRPEAAARCLAERLRRGEPSVGFGHGLYPEGDPRATALLAHLREACPGAEAVALADALIAANLAAGGEAPTIDFALVTLSLALGLPAGAPLALFAIGRTIGWVAHAIEEYAHDRLIRPRARYVGSAPAPE